VTLTGIGYKTQEHLDALKKSQEGIKFGEVKFIQLGSIVDVNTWNEAVIYKLPKYIDTLYCLLIHHDGYVINPQLWKDEWLQYDYAGSPWPLPTDDYSYKSESGYLVRVGNSVGLRSKKLMNLVTTREWKSYYGNTNEDGFIACHNREWLEDRGCKFMPFDEALMFGKEAELLENKDLQTFLFHTHG
jgi:hypothetical protein